MSQIFVCEDEPEGASTDANSAITLSVYGHAIPKGDGGMGLLDQLMPEQATAE